MYTVALIGAGNMGSSLIKGLIKKGHPPSCLVAADKDESKLIALRQQFPIHVTDDNVKAIEMADVVILAVKPQFLAETLKPLGDALLKKKPLVISVAAGIRIDLMQRFINKNIAIIRAMPNLPAFIGAGITALYSDLKTDERDREKANEILGAVGTVVWVKEEKLLDSVTAISGSGPAYFLYLMEALTKAGVDLGLSSEMTKLLVLQTGLGIIKMAIEEDKPLETMREQVTSPGGTTAKAISILDHENVAKTIGQAVKGAKARAEELATELGEKV